MSTHFADKLVLAGWALKQLGIEDFERLSDMLRPPEFEDRFSFEYSATFVKIKSPRGAKSALVLDAIRRQLGEFSIGDLQKECPGVSLDMIRHLLKNSGARKWNAWGADTRPAGDAN